MTDFKIRVDRNGTRYVYVFMPPDGQPKPCLEHMLGYALGQGYHQCDAPDEPAAAPPVQTPAQPAQTDEPEVEHRPAPRRRTRSF